jgi:hypothetical protein
MGIALDDFEARITLSRSIGFVRLSDRLLYHKRFYFFDAIPPYYLNISRTDPHYQDVAARPDGRGFGIKGQNCDQGDFVFCENPTRQKPKFFKEIILAITIVAMNRLARLVIDIHGDDNITWMWTVLLELREAGLVSLLSTIWVVK